MLALQVAAGIVLAYAIIINQKKLLAIGGWLLSVLASLAAIGAMIWAGAAAIQFVASEIPPQVLHKVWISVTLIPIFLLALSGALGMIMLGGLFFGKAPRAVLRATFKLLDAKPGKDHSGAGCVPIIGLMMLMVIFNLGLSYPLCAYTPVGGWYHTVDAYGRAHGWDDGLSLFFSAVLWQWVWIPLGGYLLVTRILRKKTPNEETEAL